MGSPTASPEFEQINVPAKEWTPIPGTSVEVYSGTNVCGVTLLVRRKAEPGFEHGILWEEGGQLGYAKCSPDCTLQIVRPGKVQCDCEGPGEPSLTYS
jgi:hypothetical protein